MYAHTSRYQIRQGAIEERLRNSAEVTRPRRDQLPGALGLLILINRQTNANVSLSLWESAADLESALSDPEFRRTFAHQRLAVSEVQEQALEVVQDDLRGGAGFAVMTSYAVHAGRLEERIEHSRAVTAPAAAGLPGYRGALVLADRARNRTVSVSLWESEVAWQAARATPSFHDQRPVHRFAAGPVTEETFEVAYEQI